MTTVDTFRQSPDVLLATRTYSYLRTIAIAAGVLVLVGLLLYLQARQRSQAIASALGRRMGLGRGAETLSLCLEVRRDPALRRRARRDGRDRGGAARREADRPAARPAAAAGVRRAVDVDPGRARARSPCSRSSPGSITSWLARRADVSEALRVA